MAAFAEFAPTMIGGAADLVESTKTLFDGGGEFSRVHAGRNVPFGIREHAMGAIVNGAAAHGGIVKPYGSTFLVFSDYMRPSVRLSALMGLPVVWVWTHDSVALGEDGPVALLLSRQNIPVLDRDQLTSAEELELGGYVLWDSGAGGAQAVTAGREDGAGRDPDVILMATGAEVSPTLAAAQMLADEGSRVRVVSMPCMELFEAQPLEYREQVLPRAVSARLAVEPGATMSWWRWVGSEGDVLGLDRFGASAPGTTVLKELGFNAENIALRARALLHGASPTTS